MVLFWDILVWTLIGLPLATGGFWIHQPGLKVELSELSVPVLIVAAFAWVLIRLQKDLTRATSYRVFIWLWNSWRNWLKLYPRETLLLGCFVQTAVLAAVALRRHASISSGAADLGIFTNAIWNLTHSGQYISSVKDGMNLFADHQSPIFWLFAPFFKLFPYAETLLVMQAILMPLGAVALYRIGTQYLARFEWAVAALPLLYWAYLPMRNANAFDFHPEILMLPLFLTGIAFAQSGSKKERMLGWVFLIFGMACKESAAAVACGMGLGWLLGAGPMQTRSITRRSGIILMLLGLGVFYFDTQVVPKILGGHDYAYKDHYDRFGSTPLEILMAPFTKPALFWSSLFGWSRLKFLFWTLAPLAFLPLLNPRAVVAALPGYLMLFLSSGDHRVSIIYHYAAEPAVGLFWALPYALDRAHRFFEFTRASQKYLGVWVLFFAALAFGRPELYRIRLHTPTDHQSWLTKEFIPCVDHGATLSASGSLVPHLASRPWVHHLPKLETPGGQLLECVIYDPKVNNWPMTPENFAQLSDRISQREYARVFQCGDLEVFQSPWRKDPCMKCEPQCETPHH